MSRTIHSLQQQQSLGKSIYNLSQDIRSSCDLKVKLGRFSSDQHEWQPQQSQSGNGIDARHIREQSNNAKPSYSSGRTL